MPLCHLEALYHAILSEPSSVLFNIFHLLREHMKRIFNLYTIIIVVLVGAFLLAKLPFLDQSLDRDEGTYLYLGQETLNGARPYVDNYEMKPPGLFYSYALIRTFVGHSSTAVRWFSHLLIVINAFLLFISLRQWKWRWGALFAVASYLVFQMIPFYLSSALLLEPIVLFYFLSAIVTWQFQKGYVISGILPGMLLMLAVLTKQNIVFLIIGYFIPFAIHGYHKRKNILAFLYLTIGGLFMLAIAIALLWYQNAWSDFIYWVFDYPAQVYTQSIGLSKGIELFTTFFQQVFLQTPILWILSFSGLIAPVITRWKIQNYHYVLSFFLFSFLSITPGLRFYGHYWLLWLPSLSISIGAFVEAINQSQIIPVRRWFWISVLTVYIGVHVFIHSDLYLQPNIIKWERLVYGRNPNYEIKQICQQLKTLNIKDKELIVFGSEPQAYFYLNIQPPSPHVFLAFLNKRHERRQEMQQEFTAAISKQKPTYALYVNFPHSWSITEADAMDLYQWTRNYISNSYHAFGIYALDDHFKSTARWSQKPEDLQPKDLNYIWIMKRNQFRFDSPIEQ